MSHVSRPFVLAITGASGVVYATRLLETLINTGHDVHLTISPAGATVLKEELDIAVDLDDFHLAAMMLDIEKSEFDRKLEAMRTLAGISTADSNVLATDTILPGEVTYHHHLDFMAPIASGSYLTAGMVVCPCSGGTLSGIVHGTSSNLIQRACDVHLKENRKLVLVPRETPLSVVQLENMTKAARMGATVLPAAPGWYHGVRTLQDLVDFVVARALDQLGVDNVLIRRWGSGNGDD